MTQGTICSLIMGGQNEQASLRNRNTNGSNIYNVHTHRRVCRANSVTDPAPNTTGYNEADTNSNTCCLGQKVFPLAHKYWSSDVYPYSEAYEPIENMPIVSGDTYYDHTDGNTYILVFHESLYYGSQMNHSLTIPDKIRFNGLGFYDNHDRDEEFYFELDDYLNIPLRYKGDKCTFLSRVPTQRELETSQHFYMMSDHKWDP